MQETMTTSAERELEDALRLGYDPSRKKYFDQAFENACKTEPQARKFFEKLMSIGGEHVSFQLYNGRIHRVNQLLKKGRLWSDRRSVLRRGEPRHCHSNAAEYWAGSGGRLQIATGYALSDDDAWHEHTWNLSPSDTVLESTEPRAAYFGIILTLDESLDHFIGNVYHPLRRRLIAHTNWESERRKEKAESPLCIDQIMEADLKRAVFHGFLDYADHLTGQSESADVSYALESFTIKTDFDHLAATVASTQKAIVDVAAIILRYELDGERIRTRGEETMYQCVISPTGSYLFGVQLKAEVNASGDNSGSEHHIRPQERE